MLVPRRLRLSPNKYHTKNPICLGGWDFLWSHRVVCLLEELAGRTRILGQIVSEVHVVIVDDHEEEMGSVGTCHLLIREDGSWERPIGEGDLESDLLLSLTERTPHAICISWDLLCTVIAYLSIDGERIGHIVVDTRLEVGEILGIVTVLEHDRVHETIRHLAGEGSWGR